MKKINSFSTERQILLIKLKGLECLSGEREIFAKLLDKNEYELYFLIGSTNVKKQIYTTSNGKVKDDSVTFEYEKSLKTELEEFDDLGKVHNKISSNNDNLWQHRCW